MSGERDARLERVRLALHSAIDHAIYKLPVPPELLAHWHETETLLAEPDSSNAAPDWMLGLVKVIREFEEHSNESGDPIGGCGKCLQLFEALLDKADEIEKLASAAPAKQTPAAPPDKCPKHGYECPGECDAHVCRGSSGWCLICGRPIPEAYGAEAE
jgi:hypothetical protein